MEAAVLPLPNNVEALQALLAMATQRADEAEAALANARARETAAQAMIAHLKLQNAKLRREQYGPSAERTERLLAQMELELEDLEADAAEDELAAEAAAAKTTTVIAFERKSLSGSRSPITSRANAWSSPRRARAQPAAATACPSSARM